MTKLSAHPFGICENTNYEDNECTCDLMYEKVACNWIIHEITK